MEAAIILSGEDHLTAIFMEFSITFKVSLLMGCFHSFLFIFSDLIQSNPFLNPIWQIQTHLEKE